MFLNDHNGLVVTEVGVKLWSQSDSRLLAFATFTLNGAVVISGIRILQLHDGRVLVAFPDRQKQDGSYFSQAFPCSQPAR